MTNEEANQLVARAKGDVRGRALIPTYLSWGLTVASSPLWLVPDSSFFGLVSLVFGFTALCVTSANREDLRKLDAAKARNVWNFMHARSWLGHEFHPATWDLKTDIDRLYQHDARGDTLPLAQAVRLLDAHHRQQGRLVLVSHRLEQLQLLKQTMQAKLAQLQRLGEAAPEAARSLAQIERDEAALQTAQNQIAASCARLEAIFTSVQHAHQVRTLKRELGELSQEVGGSSSGVQLDAEAFDIERQIGREIETFLALERETEEHLQDL